MGKKINSRRIEAIVCGIITIAFILLTDNFSFFLGPKEHSMAVMLFNIFLPKIAFSCILGIGFLCTVTHEKLKNSILISLSPIVAVFVFQLVFVILNFKDIQAILAMNDSRGTFYTFPIWIFLAVLAFLDILYYDDWKKRFFMDLLIITVITLAFYLQLLFLNTHFNSLYAVGFQIGGFFIVRGILGEK